MPERGSVLVCWGCCNKQNKFKQKGFISSQFWGLEVQDQGVGRLGSIQGL